MTPGLGQVLCLPVSACLVGVKLACVPLSLWATNLRVWLSLQPRPLPGQVLGEYLLRA